MTSLILNFLVTAIQNNDKRYFKEILEENINQLSDLEDSDKFNIFHYISSSKLSDIIMTEFFEIIVRLLSQKFSLPDIVNMLNSKSERESNSTPLHISIMTCKTVLFIQKLALEYIKTGANPLITNDLGQNALHVSVRAGLLSFFCFLLEDFKMDINLKENYGTVLHSSIVERREDMALLIITKINCIDTQNNEGNTPLHLAISTGNYLITRHLLINGANRRIVNNFHKTPAQLCDSKDLASLLSKKFKRKNIFYLIFAIFCITIRFSILLEFIIKRLNIMCVSVWVILTVCLYIINIMIFVYLACKNPGFEKSSNVSLKVSSI